jgi:hypothetical protein
MKGGKRRKKNCQVEKKQNNGRQGLPSETLKAKIAAERQASQKDKVIGDKGTPMPRNQEKGMVNHEEGQKGQFCKTHLTPLYWTKVHSAS